MTKNTPLYVAALALAALSVASAKTYDIVLSAPAKVASAQLTPGEYKVKVDGANAVFTDAKTLKSVTVPVKIDKGDKKYDNTLVDMTKQGDTDQIQTIELGGSTTKLEFGQ
jgi:hypothetical protein